MNGLLYNDFLKRLNIKHACSIAGKCLSSLKFILHFPRFLWIIAVIFLLDGFIFGLSLADLYVELEGIPLPEWFDNTQEMSFGEIWEYFLTGAAAVFLIWKFNKFREPIVATLSIVFVWLTLDNMLALHEQSGHLLAPLFPFANGSSPSPQDFGELAAFSSVGIMILAAVVFSIPRSSENAKVQSFWIVIMLACGAVFGVGLDFVHQFFQSSSPLVLAMFGFVEDGAELMFLSVSAALAISLDMSGAAAE